MFEVATSASTSTSAGRLLRFDAGRGNQLLFVDEVVGNEFCKRIRGTCDRLERQCLQPTLKCGLREYGRGKGTILHTAVGALFPAQPGVEVIRLRAGRRWQTASRTRPPATRSRAFGTAYESANVNRGDAAGIALPSGATMSLRPPRRRNDMRTCTVRASSRITRRPFDEFHSPTRWRHTAIRPVPSAD